jgi:hypothetical protein
MLNVIQHNAIFLTVILPSVIQLNIILKLSFDECCLVWCHFVNCHSAECHLVHCHFDEGHD